MQFFVLKKEPRVGHLSARLDASRADGTKYGVAPRCESCGQYVGMRAWLPPYRVELEAWGHELADLAVIGTDLLVSLRFKHAWARSGLVGVDGFDDVEVVKVKSHCQGLADPPAYCRAVVSRSGTAIDLDASYMEWDKPPSCHTCRLSSVIKRWHRVVIDETTWTGEDVCIARGLPSEIIVTERFKAFCERYNIRNAVCVPAETYHHDFYPSEREATPPLPSRGDMEVTLIGVHPVVGSEPCHLIELELTGSAAPLNWGAVTQEVPGRPRANWQVAYDETPLNSEGTRWAFFMHYLDFSKPLLTPAGSLSLPAPTPLPDRLEHVKYVEP